MEVRLLEREGRAPREALELVVVRTLSLQLRYDRVESARVRVRRAGAEHLFGRVAADDSNLNVFV